MKTKDKRNILIILILFPIFLWLTLTFTNDNENTFKPYSIFNNGEKGVSVIHKSFSELGYTTGLILTEVYSQDTSMAQIVIESERPYKLDLNSDNIKNWIGNGGALIYLVPNWDSYVINYGSEIDSYASKERKDAKAYSYNKGLLVMGDPIILNNKTLTTNTDGAYWLVAQLDNIGIDSINFNEYYHYYEGHKPSLWRDIPAGIKFAIYQVAIVLIIIIYYYGKRFGKVVPLYEEVERTENEYIYSAASLFKKGELREDVILNIYDNFLSSFEDSTGHKSTNNYISWINIWEKEKLPDMSKAKKLYKFIETMKNGKKISSREMLEIVDIIEHLKKIIDKGREVHWRELKRDTQSI